VELERHKLKGNEEIDRMFRTIQQACIARKKEFKAIFEAEVTRKVGLFDECIAKSEDHCEHSQEGLRLVKRGTMPRQALFLLIKLNTSINCCT
jgi:hypothetical protein